MCSCKLSASASIDDDTESNISDTVLVIPYFFRYLFLFETSICWPFSEE